MALVYVVEDDDSIREMLLYALKAAGFEVLGLDSGSDVFPAMENAVPNLLLLDIMLPGIDGISILKRICTAEVYKDIPVIMLTAKGSELDRIKGFDYGADDYVVKPFSVMEVISRIKAVLKRCSGGATQKTELVIGDLRLESDRHMVYAEGKEINLTFKEFELLRCLMENVGIVLSRDKLLQHVWGFDYNGESRTVDMHIKTLRRKLGAAGDLIVTVRNVGYKIGA